MIGEAFYVNLGADGLLDDGSAVEADVRQFLGELAAGYRIGPTKTAADFIVGVRYTSLGSEIGRARGMSSSSTTSRSTDS